MIKNTYKIKVPATSANLGSGFDTMGVAFDLYNTFVIKELQTNELIIEGVSEEFQNENNLFYQAFKSLINKVNYPLKGLYIKEDNQVPFGKGLGSSATCIIGGLVGANTLCGNPFNENEILNMAAIMEGHPDNASPALYGNLTASMMTKNQTLSLVEKISPNFSFLACIPNFELLTEHAREILPKSYGAKDIVYNISHSIFTFEAFKTGKSDLLKLALGDKLHQPYRFGIIKESDKIRNFVKANNYIGCYLSGAGPTIIIVSENKEEPKQKLKEFINTLSDWEYREMIPSKSGCTVEII